MHEERCQKAQEEANNKIRLTEQECAKLIGERRMAAQAIVDQLALDAEEERKKYLSIVAAIANTQSESEQNLYRHVCIKEVVQDDIGYLLNNVVHHLSNPDILYKLIWSEYIQKPTNEMLDYVDTVNEDMAETHYVRHLIYRDLNDDRAEFELNKAKSLNPQVAGIFGE